MASSNVPLLQRHALLPGADAQRRGPRRQLSGRDRVRSGPTMPAATGRRFATSASAAITAGRFARRTFRKPAFPLVPNFAPASSIPAIPNRYKLDRQPPGQLPGGSWAARCSPRLTDITPSLADRERQQSEPEGGDFRFLDVRRGHSAAGGSAAFRCRSTITISGERHHCIAHGAAIVNACYDAPNLNNIFCQQFTRYLGQRHPSPFGDTPGQRFGQLADRGAAELREAPEEGHRFRSQLPRQYQPRT